VARNRHLAVEVVWRGAWPKRGEPLAILLPGREQTADFALDIAGRLDLPALNCAAVAADANSWYPGSFLDPIERNQPSLDHSLERIETLVVEAVRRGVPRERIALLGFSQGACVACEYVYRHPARWGALIALTGGLFGPAGQQWVSEGRNLADTPVLVTNSDIDPFIPLSRTRETGEVFRQMGAQVSEQVYQGREHEVSAAEIAVSRGMLRNLSKPPGD
jgi:predicted esterase